MIDFDKVTQRQLEDYFKAYRELGGKEEGIGLVEYAGAMARAAVKVGWFTMDVDNANPREVQKVQREIQDYVKSVLEPDTKN